MFQANQTFQHQKQKLKRKKGEIGHQIEFLKCVQKIKEVEKQTKKEKTNNGNSNKTKTDLPSIETFKFPSFLTN